MAKKAENVSDARLFPKPKFDFDYKKVEDTTKKEVIKLFSLSRMKTFGISI